MNPQQTTIDFDRIADQAIVGPDPRTAATRRESFLQKLPGLSSQRVRILSHFVAVEDRGATLAETADAVAQGHSNRVCQAIADLRSQGLIEATDIRRQSASGRFGVVHRVTAAGIAALSTTIEKDSKR